MADPSCLDKDAPYADASPSLIRRIRLGDPEAWQQFVALYGPLVYHWCRQARLTPHDALDVAQEVFLAVLQGIEGFANGGRVGRLRGWLRVITRNQVRELYRRRQHCPETAVGDSQALEAFVTAPEPTDTDHPAFSTERCYWVRYAVEQVRSEFKEQRWVAFWRFVMRSDRAEHVAADLGMSVSAVYRARDQVLARVRELYGEFLEHDGPDLPPAGPPR